MIFPSYHFKVSASRNSFSCRSCSSQVEQFGTKVLIVKDSKPGWTLIVNVRKVHLQQYKLVFLILVFLGPCAIGCGLSVLSFFKS